MMKRRQGAAYLSFTAIMTSTAVILSYYPEIPMPFFAPWLKLDLSFTPLLLLGFSLGPAAGIFSLLVTNAVRLLGSTSSGVGEIANLIVGASYLLPAALAYRRRRTRKAALVGMAAGVLLMTAAGALSNLYLLMPFYFGDRILDFDMPGYLVSAVVPFNLVKGAVNSFLVLVLYKRLSRFLKEAQGESGVAVKKQR